MAKLELLACQPRSASTVLAKYLAKLGGGKTYSFVPAYGRHEKEPCTLRLLRRKIGQNLLLFGQHHVRRSDETIRVAGKFNMPVVVLRLSLFDAVASTRDYFRQENRAAGPVMYLTKDMIELPDREFESALARFAVPWYLNFHRSWREYEPAISVDHEQVRMDAEGTARNILKTIGLIPGDNSPDIDEVKATAHFNAGVSGRGASIAPEAVQIIEDHVRFYLQFGDDPHLRLHLPQVADGAAHCRAARHRRPAEG